MRKSSLDIAKVEIISFFDRQDKKVYKTYTIKDIFYQNRDSWQLVNSISLNNFLEYLVKNANFEKTVLTFPSRKEIMYSWGKVSIFEIALAIKSGSYFTHHTAMLLHGLTNKSFRVIYVNHEQAPKRYGSSDLIQERIDAAFRKAPRVSRNKARYKENTILLINGMHTGEYGVINTLGENKELIRLTNIERTLIDISVRPVYSGGVHQVLNAYKLARDKVSIKKLVSTLKMLGYTYPYHQIIGFYMEKTGLYEEKELMQLNEIGIFYDFYLTHGMRNTSYSNRWRLYYPKDFD